MSNNQNIPKGEPVNLVKDNGAHKTAKLDSPLQDYKNAPTESGQNKHEHRKHEQNSKKSADKEAASESTKKHATPMERHLPIDVYMGMMTLSMSTIQKLIQNNIEFSQKILSLANNNKPQNFLADAIENSTEACKKAQQIIADAAEHANEIAGHTPSLFQQSSFNPFNIWTITQATPSVSVTPVTPFGMPTRALP